MIEYADLRPPKCPGYLMETGAVFANAHYQHANTETIVGHATLATGAFPSKHGMVGNVWFDRDTGELSYNIEDPNHPLLPSRKEKAEALQPTFPKQPLYLVWPDADSAIRIIELEHTWRGGNGASDGGIETGVSSG